MRVAIALLFVLAQVPLAAQAIDELGDDSNIFTGFTGAGRGNIIDVTTTTTLLEIRQSVNLVGVSDLRFVVKRESPAGSGTYVVEGDYLVAAQGPGHPPYWSSGPLSQLLVAGERYAIMMYWSSTGDYYNDDTSTVFGPISFGTHADNAYENNYPPSAVVSSVHHAWIPHQWYVTSLHTYTAIDLGSRTYTSISSTGTPMTSVSGCDDCTEAVTLPFPFWWYNRTVQTITISSNGQLNMDASASSWCCSSVSIPGGDGNDDRIFFVKEDLDPAGVGGIYTETQGAPGNRVFIVEFDGTSFFPGPATGLINCQVRLFENPRGWIEIYWGAGDNAGQTWSAGVEDIGAVDGTAAVGPSFDLTGRTSIWPTNTACRFVPTFCSAAQCGDCDLGGTGPNVVDALRAAQIAVGIFVPSVPTQVACCDVDSSGAVAIVDALQIAQVAVGMPVLLICF